MSSVAILMTQEELEALIDRRVSAALLTVAPAPAELMSLAQVCELMGVTRATVAKWIREDGFPHVPIGNRTNRFKRSEVLAWKRPAHGGKRH